jgi:hypothetical protein
MKQQTKWMKHLMTYKKEKENETTNEMDEASYDL